MNVKELKNLLSKYPDDTQIEIETDIDTHEDFTVDMAYDTVVIKTF